MENKECINIMIDVSEILILENSEYFYELVRECYTQWSNLKGFINHNSSKLKYAKTNS